MKILRVEHPETGLGPYQMGSALNKTHLYCDEARPGPHEDGIPKGCYDPDYHFAFKSEGDLTRWFTPDDLKDFHEDGLCVFEYEVPKDSVLVGGKQVAFLLSKAYSKKRVNILNLRKRGGTGRRTDTDSPAGTCPGSQERAYRFDPCRLHQLYKDYQQWRTSVLHGTEARPASLQSLTQLEAGLRAT